MTLLNCDFLLNKPLPAVPCGLGKGEAQSVSATDSHFLEHSVDKNIYDE